MLHVGYITDEQYFILQDMIENMISDVYNSKQSIKTVIFYLKTDPKKSFDRIKRRGRIQEKNVSLYYLKILEDLHFKVFSKLPNVMVYEFAICEENVDKVCDTIVNIITGYLDCH